MSDRKDQQTTAVIEPIRPKYVAGTFGDVLADFRTNVKLSVKEMDEIIVNHGFTRERLEPIYNLLKILWSYQMKNNTSDRTIRMTVDGEPGGGMSSLSRFTSTITNKEEK